MQTEELTLGAPIAIAGAGKLGNSPLDPFPSFATAGVGSQRWCEEQDF